MRKIIQTNTGSWVVCIFLSLLMQLMFVQGAGDNPTADPKAMVITGQARFTVLTPQLIRCEWSGDGHFEDRASLVFVNRRLGVPAFEVKDTDEWLQIHTDRLVLEYRKSSGAFTAANLTISLQLGGKPVVWHPGLEDKGNLKGTTRTLDDVEGATSLEPGLISRDGWVVVDDSIRPLFDGSDWPWCVARTAGERQDWYFFGYGHDFKQALQDFTRVAGKIPLPPRFAFGTWWSRYWAYTDREFKELVEEFANHDVPLDVLVIDMDWHQTFNMRWWKEEKDQSGHTLGWTGYTWDKNYFPDPPAFLAWCESRGLKTPLNLHPASGVQPHEEKYEEMARAMGVDPATRQYIPFDIVDKKFAENYLNILHRPLEKQGVDFWWLDYQQQQTTKMTGLNPTWWLNYVHFTDMERQGKRPLIFHRWGGLGNHRYQIGFSGDTISVWPSLAFQPYFTATAANVGYGYWSHDIGGHMPGKVSPELYTRWIQFGVFSPILRTHTTKNPEAERRIWAYPAQYFKVMREAFLLRYALIPYIYTAGRTAHDTGLSLCRPLYYDYPQYDEAYESTGQYMFGDDLLVAPVTEAIDAQNSLCRKSIWLPPGAWLEWSSGERLSGPARLERYFAIDEIPVYVKAGAIIPMQPRMRHNGEKPVNPLILNVFPTDKGSGRVYEDEGNSLGYKSGQFAWTQVTQTKEGPARLKVTIDPPKGGWLGMPHSRGYELRLAGVWPPRQVTCNGRAIPYNTSAESRGWHYEGDQLQLVIKLPVMPTGKPVETLIQWPDASGISDGIPPGFAGKLARLLRVMPILNSLWPKEWSPEIMIHLAQTGTRLTYFPETATRELKQFEEKYPEVLKAIAAMKDTKDVDPTIIDCALAHLEPK